MIALLNLNIVIFLDIYNLPRGSDAFITIGKMFVENIQFFLESRHYLFPIIFPNSLRRRLDIKVISPTKLLIQDNNWQAWVQSLHQHQVQVLTKEVFWQMKDCVWSIIAIIVIVVRSSNNRLYFLDGTWCYLMTVKFSIVHCFCCDPKKFTIVSSHFSSLVNQIKSP